jgi:hypothetical protein
MERLTEYNEPMSTVTQAKNIVLAALFALTVLWAAPASAAVDLPPEVSASDVGAPIDDVVIETYGVTTPDVAKRYLSLHKGDTLTQAGVVHDYVTLERLADLRTRLQVQRDPDHGVTLHWIVLGKWFEITDHPFYGDQPLTIPIGGLGTVVTSPPLDRNGTTVSSYTQIALRAKLGRAVVTRPLWVNAARGREGDLIVNYLGARGDIQTDQPIIQDIYSWAQGPEVLYLDRGTNGTQWEFGARTSRATSTSPSYITAPSVLDTYDTPAQSTTLEVGLSHACARPRLYPPYCYLQYRVEGLDSIGGLGANNIWHSGFVDLSQYNRVGASTLVFHVAVNRSGGRLPTSNLPCTNTWSYAKPICGTDTNLLEAELRLADARPGIVKAILFANTSAARFRGGDQSFVPSSFFWRGDAGVGVAYRTLRVNLAYGTTGGRITVEVVGSLF